MALCTLLLVGASLLLRSVIHLQGRDPGFDATGLYAIDVQLPEARYKNQASQVAFMSDLNERARRLPGVEGMTLAATAPPGSAMLIGALQFEGQPDPPAGTTAFIIFNGVEPDFFKLMRMRIVEGTSFTDTTKAAAQAIVNEGLARKQWPGQSAVGRKLRVVYNGRGDWKTIVGVVNDAYTQGLTDEVTEPILYTPGSGFFRPSLLVRTAGDASVIQNFAKLVAGVDAKLPPPQIKSVDDAMRKTIARPRFTMFLLMIFTIVAVGLAAVGLYGVLAYTVAQRTREIGIRVALGASRQRVARAVMSRGLLLAGIGAAIGLGVARWGVKLLGSMLYGVQQTDVVSFAMGAVILFLIAVVACLVPVRRALSVDPLIAMRAD
jgi:putative ABC transport system permease protein